MPTAWYIVPYSTTINPEGSFPLANRFLDLPSGVDIAWNEIEIEGNRAIVKITAPALVITELSNSFQRLQDNVDIVLTDSTAQERNNLRDLLLSVGYVQRDINQKFPDGLNNTTTREILKEVAKAGRTKPRFDPDSQMVVFDSGVRVNCEPVDGLVDRDQQREINQRQSL